MSLKRGLQTSTDNNDDADAAADIYVSAPITDRQSTFVAHFSPTLSARALQAHRAFRDASHRIAAWRKPSAQRKLVLAPSAASKSVLETGHDDDGEKWAGRRLERLLEALGVEGAVCVARWYGGVMLGPVRFEHIEGVAKEAVRQWRAAATTKTAEQSDTKRQKVAESTKSKEELVRLLERRDGSIEVLRGLLAEKKRVLLQEQEDGGSNNNNSAETSKDDGATPKVLPKMPINYKAMPVQALAKLEKARDATIAFILKELDKVEDQILKEMGGDDGDDDGGDDLDGINKVGTQDSSESSSSRKPAPTTPAPDSARQDAEHQDATAAAHDTSSEKKHVTAQDGAQDKTKDSGGVASSSKLEADAG